MAGFFQGLADRIEGAEVGFMRGGFAGAIIGESEGANVARMGGGIATTSAAVNGTMNALQACSACGVMG